LPQPDTSSRGRRQSVRVVELGTSVLRAVGQLGGSATLSELSAFVQQPPSKTHRYLQALMATGFIEQDATTDAYRLGAESLSLGLTALASIDVVSAATASIAALSAAINETVLLAIWANHGATVVHVKEPLRRVTVITRMGSVLPLLSSASGLIFAAYLPEDDTPRDATAERRLKAIRHSGLAAIQGLFFPGIDAIAAPVVDATGKITAAITVLGPTTSFDVSLEGSVAARLAATAMAVSARMGYRGPWPPAASSARTRSKSSGVSTPEGGAAAKTVK
jgi:DNA-binding IclR family transcriptional regulator